MEKILTISVAAYNVENYLVKLIQSVIACPSNSMIEMLIVNDGSKDKTLAIAEEYQRRYPDVISIINKENGGHGSTINQGILNAHGKYFRALDGDDWVDTNGLNTLLQYLKTTDADLVICDYLECYESGRVKRVEFHNIPSMSLFPANDILPKMEWLPYHAVIYKTALLQKEKIKLDEHCFYVDAEYMAFPMPYVSTIIYFSIPVYCYRLGEMGQSVSASSRMKHVSDSKRVAYKMMDFFTSCPDINYTAIREYMLKGVTRSCLWHFNTLMVFSPKRLYKEELKMYDMDIKRICPEVFSILNRYSRIRMIRNTNYLYYYVEGIKNLMRKVKNSIQTI